jgi:diguanylate cyclase (GGDEF)-like protein
MRDALNHAERQLTSDPADAGPEDEPPADPQYNLLSREQLEKAVQRWWKDDPQHELPLSLGLVDVDRFRDVNEACGMAAGDRILDAVAQLVGGVPQGKQRAARLSAQQFLLMFPSASAREATNILERVRQQIEATRFEYSSGSIAVTVSCSVAQATEDDTWAALTERVEATLLEAKRYGRNRTFLHDGKFPAPVVPPVLPIEGRTLAV